MDGSTPSIGDRVHDILLGSGVIRRIHLSTAEIEVTFGGSTITYSSTGHLGDRRRLDWENPIQVLPRKGENLARVIAPMVELLRTDRLNRTP